MVLAIVAGIAVMRGLAQRQGMATAQSVYDLAFVVVIAALVGARLYAVLLFWPEYAQNPLEVFKVWHGGMAIHGALIGGTLALWVYCRKKKQSFLQWADVIAVALPLGQAIGRWGNYFNQELFGPPTNLPWGIFIASQNRPAGLEQSAYFHPTFLYESLLNLTLFFVLLWVYLRLYRQRSPMTMTNDLTRRHDLRPMTGAVKTMTSDHTRSYDQRPMTGAVQTMTTDQTRRPDLQPKPGNIVALYLLGYGIIRLLMETLRLDETPMLFGLRWPMLMSITLIIGGIVILAIKNFPPPRWGRDRERVG